MRRSEVFYTIGYQVLSIIRNKTFIETLLLF
jgi:hypothetical protein